jgi:two-component system, LytTR family, response regulator
LINGSPSLQVAGIATTGNSGLAKIEQLNPDLVFLDIQLPDISGVELLRMLHEKAVKVVIVSGYEQYAAIGYELCVVDYLRKPYGKERFEQMVERVVLKVRKREALFKNPAGLSVEEFVLVKSDQKNRHQKIYLSEISYIEVDKNLLTFHCVSEKIVTSTTMKEIEYLLPARFFLRIHKSFIIAVNHVSAFDNHDVILKSKVSLPIGATYQKKVLELLGK